MADRDEAALLASWRLALAGDNDAYARFLAQAALRVRRHLRRRLVLQADDVEDLVQETLLAVHNHRSTWRPAQPIVPWLLAIARHKAIDALRAQAPRRAAEVPLGDDSATFADAMADPHAGDAEARRDLRVLIEGLPPAFRAAIVAVKLGGLSVAEAASRLGMSESAVKVNVHRGLKLLARRVQGGR